MAGRAVAILHRAVDKFLFPQVVMAFVTTGCLSLLQQGNLVGSMRIMAFIAKNQPAPKR